MTVNNCCHPTQPCPQQENALKLLDSLIDNANIRVEKMDENGYVTSLVIFFPPPRRRLGRRAHYRIPANKRLDALPENFSRLFPEVSNLRLTSCPNLTDISSIGGMRKLRELCLLECPVPLIGFPLCEGLKKLTLRDCNAFDYALSLRNLEGLEEFELQDEELDQVPLAIWSLSDLKRLVLFGNRLTVIPNDIGNLQHLEDLHIGGWRITSLSRGIGALVHLKNIRFRSEQITELPDEMGELTELERVDLSGCWNLKRIPAPLLQLPHLGHLDLTGCKVLSIPKRNIFECTDSLIELKSGNNQEGYSDDCKQALVLLQHMVKLNKDGRYLLKAKKEIPLALWGVVLGRCSNNHDANSLFFFLKQKPNVIPASSRKRKVGDL